MEVRVVIVDDERPARDRIRKMLASHTDFKIVAEAQDVRSAVRCIDEQRPDLCFLDVQIPGGDGFDVLRRVAHVPRVVFTTAYDQYAVRAFEVNSLDYLLKPFDRKRFASALQRVRDSIRRESGPPGRAMTLLLEQIREGLPQIKALADRAAEQDTGSTPDAVPERIVARRGPRILLLDPAEVRFFEAEDTLVFARTLEGRFLVERTLGELEQQLGGRFFRTHRGFLVNLSQISEILPAEGGTFKVMLRGEEADAVPLSRRQARKLRERLPW